MKYLPNKVKALHQLFEVIPTRAGEYSCLGECDPNCLQIQISDRIPAAKQLECLWHEVAHVYEKNFSWYVTDEDAETFCYRLGIIVMQVLRDNPAILQLHADLLEEQVDELPDDEEEEPEEETSPD